MLLESNAALGTKAYNTALRPAASKVPQFSPKGGRVHDRTLCPRERKMAPKPGDSTIPVTPIACHGLTTRASLSEQQDGWAGPPGQELGQAKRGGSRWFHESSVQLSFQSRRSRSGKRRGRFWRQRFPIACIERCLLVPMHNCLDTHAHREHTETSESFIPHVISSSGQS